MIVMVLNFVHCQSPINIIKESEWLHNHSALLSKVTINFIINTITFLRKLKFLAVFFFSTCLTVRLKQKFIAHSNL